MSGKLEISLDYLLTADHCSTYFGNLPFDTYLLPKRSQILWIAFDTLYHQPRQTDESRSIQFHRYEILQPSLDGGALVFQMSSHFGPSVWMDPNVALMIQCPGHFHKLQQHFPELEQCQFLHYGAMGRKSPVLDTSWS